EMDDENSYLLGAGDFEGSFLELSHYPVNMLYGFQVGIAANSKHAKFGMAGWFHYDGVLNGQMVDGHGDINIDKECNKSSFETECVYVIDRYWIADDGCGNTTIMEQTITVSDTIGPDFTAVPEDLTLNCFDEVPEVDLDAVEAVDNCGGPVEITYLGEFFTG